MWFCFSFSVLSAKKLQYNNESDMCAGDKQLVISCGRGSGFCSAHSRYEWYLSGWLGQAQDFCNTKNEKSKQVQNQVMRLTPFALQRVYPPKPSEERKQI